MSTLNGDLINSASQAAKRNAQLQRVAAWAFAIDKKRQDAQKLARLYQAAAALGATEMNYGALQQVASEAERMQAIGQAVASANNPFIQTSDPASAAKAIRKDTPAEDRDRLYSTLPAEERQTLAETDSEGSAPAGVVAETLPENPSGTDKSAVPTSIDSAPAMLPRKPVSKGTDASTSQSDASESVLEGEKDNREGSSAAESDAYDSQSEQNDRLDGASPTASGRAWFDQKTGHKITGQKLTLYGQRTEAVGRAARIASRSIRKKGGERFYGGAKKVEGFGRSAQKGGKVLQKAGTALAVAQSIKELGSGDIKKSIATAVRTGGSLLITRLAFWVSGLFGLTIKGLIITAVVWNIILFVSMLFHLNIPKWMRWAIIGFDLLLPILVIVIVMFLLLGSCYVAKGNSVASAITTALSFVHPGVWVFSKFCSVVGL